jgi:hypothetical protein
LLHHSSGPRIARAALPCAVVHDANIRFTVAALAAKDATPVVVPDIGMPEAGLQFAFTFEATQFYQIIVSCHLLFLVSRMSLFLRLFRKEAGFAFLAAS